MKKIILALTIIYGSLVADEINIKVSSFVEHHMDFGFKWNEGFNNQAKGIEYISEIDETHGVGLTYLNFTNSFYKKTIAKGFVYRYKKTLTENLSLNTKLYVLYQKGYYGKWNKLQGYSNTTDNKFWAPLVSLGVNYHGFTLDGLGTSDTLHAVVFGYAWEF